MQGGTVVCKGSNLVDINVDDALDFPEEDAGADAETRRRPTTSQVIRTALDVNANVGATRDGGVIWTDVFQPVT